MNTIMLLKFYGYDFLIGAIIKADSLLLHIEMDPYCETMYVVTDNSGRLFPRPFPHHSSRRKTDS